MKKRLIYSCFFIATALFSGCTKDFTKINTNPNATSADVFNPNFLLAQAQIQYSQTGYDQLLYQSMWSQSLASTYDYYGNGDKYIYKGSFNDYKARVYNSGYSAETLIQEMKNLTAAKAQYANLNNIGAIMKVFILQRVTDAYGDIPYSEAGMAKQGIFTPKFDKQQAIYASMLSELDAATAALDASKDKPSSDLFYSGDITKWKKLGYSLMLRVAMRLTKVDLATAQKYAEKAYAGGTMASVDDNAKVKTDNSNGNGNSTVGALTVPDDFREVRWSKTLIDFMKTTVDPRISAIAEIASGTGKAANSDETTAGISTAALQEGMPNGYDLNGGATDISKAPGYPGTSPADPSVKNDAPAADGKYSRPRLAVYYTASSTLIDKSAINMLLTYGETELLLAEASTRGWNTGSAATHYANALAADMLTLAQFNAAATISSGLITAYVSAHPLIPGTALQQINMEYYVETSSTFNFNETWANWRRSAFPVLTPVKYAGQFTDGSIPRRIQYPLTLVTTNTANYQSGVASLSGGDTFISRIYWDK
jgi:hypothetical protein